MARKVCALRASHEFLHLSPTLPWKGREATALQYQNFLSLLTALLSVNPFHETVDNSFDNVSAFIEPVDHPALSEPLAKGRRQRGCRNSRFTRRAKAL